MPRRSGSRPPPDARARRAAPVLALALVLALAACPGPTPRPIPSPSPSPSRPSPSSSLIVAYPHEPPTLDPFAPGGEGPPARDLARLLMPSLERIGPAGERTPWLLVAEPVVDAGPPFTVTVTLRDGARWSDGSPITTADLRFTWKAAVASGSVGAEGYDRIADVMAESPQRARIVFREPFRRWRDLFSAGVGLLPEHALRGKDLRRALAQAWPVSGGPFTLERWTPGLEMVFARNPRAPGGAARVGRLHVVFVSDAPAALELFRRGEVDAMAGYHAIDFARRAREAGARIASEIGATEAVLLLDPRAAPLDDARVRRALALSIDRARLATGLVREEGERLDTLLAGEAGLRVPAFAPGADVERAEELLEEAGWRGSGVRRRGGKKLEVTVALIGSDSLAGVVVRAARVQAQRAGFQLTPVGLDPDILWRDWLHGRRVQAALVVWRDPPGGSLRGRFGSGLPLSRLALPALDRALAEADRALDPAAAAEPSARAQRLLAEAVPAIPLYAARVTVAARRGVDGLRGSASADGPFWNAGEWAVAGGEPSERAAAPAADWYPFLAHAGVLELADRHG